MTFYVLDEAILDVVFILKLFFCLDVHEVTMLGVVFMFL